MTARTRDIPAKLLPGPLAASCLIFLLWLAETLRLSIPREGACFATAPAPPGCMTVDRLPAAALTLVVMVLVLAAGAFFTRTASASTRWSFALCYLLVAAACHYVVLHALFAVATAVPASP